MLFLGFVCFILFFTVTCELLPLSLVPTCDSPPRSQSATMRRRATPPLTKLGSSSQPLVSWCWGVGAFTLEGLGKFIGRVSMWEASSWGHF